MIAVVYKKSLKQEGVNYLPQKTLNLAKKKADKLRSEGYLSVKVVTFEEKIVYIPELGEVSW